MSTIAVKPPQLGRNNNNSDPRISIKTLGCKVNFFESELIAQKLAVQSWQRVTLDERADFCIINTCSVTAQADRQTRQAIRRAIRTNPDAKVIVTGCYAELAGAQCAAIPGVDLVVGNHRKLDIPTLLYDIEQSDNALTLRDTPSQDVNLLDQLVSGFDGRTRAFLLIQQGCDQGCTFCIIHKARGPSRSFPRNQILQQFEHLISNGYREIVLCGVDLGSYSLETGHNLASLIREMVRIPGDFRLRLSSIDPAHIDDVLIQALVSSEKICPHIHLSIQSGNNLILKRMKRRATREILYSQVEALRNVCQSLVLSADILVGFPTEKESHFLQTLQAVTDLGIAFPHVFVYSPREGTPAACILDQVPIVERKARAEQVRLAGRAVWQQLAEAKIGQVERVLVESQYRNRPGWVKARADDYFSAIFEAKKAQVGYWAQVRVLGYDEDGLTVVENDDLMPSYRDLR